MFCLWDKLCTKPRCGSGIEGLSRVFIPLLAFSPWAAAWFSAASRDTWASDGCDMSGFGSLSRACTPRCCLCSPATATSSGLTLLHAHAGMWARAGKGCECLFWMRLTIAKASTDAQGSRAPDAATGQEDGCGQGDGWGQVDGCWCVLPAGSTGAGEGLSSCCHPPSLHSLALCVVVMIAMEIISICFAALRCCVLHCLDGKLLDWFWRVAVHAQILADFFVWWKVGDSQHGFN